MNYTNLEQSKKLLELGLNAESADMHYGNFCVKGLGYCNQFRAGLTSYLKELEVYEENKKLYGIDNYDGIVAWEVLPCWSTGQLLKIIENCVYVQLIHDGVMWNMTVQDHDKPDVKHHEMDDELIEICYKTMCWLLKNGYKWQE